MAFLVETSADETAQLLPEKDATKLQDPPKVNGDASEENSGDGMPLPPRFSLLDGATDGFSGVFELSIRLPHFPHKTEIHV